MAEPMRLLPCGDAAFLIELDGLDTAVRVAERVGSADLDDVLAVVPAARTVLVRCEPGAVAAVARQVRSLPPTDRVETTGHDVVIPVVYDGEDLDEVAELTGLSREEVVERHQSTPWKVAFTGFAPGFGYLVGGDGSLTVPRRAEPRTRVPAGSVGLAGEFTGVYPRPSPGGWQLIGRTDAVVWDPHRRRPALLAPGNTVRFEQAGQ